MKHLWCEEALFVWSTHRAWWGLWQREVQHLRTSGAGLSLIHHILQQLEWWLGYPRYSINYAWLKSMEYNSTLFGSEHFLAWKFLGKWPTVTWPGGLCHVETRNIPSPKGLLISHDLSWLAWPLLWFFSAQALLPHPPLPSFRLASKKNTLTWGGIIITLLQSESWLSCSIIITTSDLDVRRRENWGQNSPPTHSAPGRPYKVIQLTPEMKPACHSQKHKQVGTLKLGL